MNAPMPASAPTAFAWFTDAVTVFINGAIGGFWPGTVVGGAGVAGSDTLDPQQLTITAALGILLTAVANGAKHFVIWHHSNPVPNPFKRIPDEPPRS